MLDVALDHHRNGRLVQAQAGYAQILQFDEKNFDALHLLGVLAQQIGKPQGAVEFIGRAIAINRKEPFAHFNLANALVELGRTQEAVASYKCAADECGLAIEAEIPEGLPRIFAEAWGAALR